MTPSVASAVPTKASRAPVTVPAHCRPCRANAADHPRAVLHALSPGLEREHHPAWLWWRACLHPLHILFPCAHVQRSCAHSAAWRRGRCTIHRQCSRQPLPHSTSRHSGGTALKVASHGSCSISAFTVPRRHCLRVRRQRPPRDVGTCGVLGSDSLHRPRFGAACTRCKACLRPGRTAASSS